VGTVTFLFTDIEGSTQLLRELQDAYIELLERHRELLTSIVSDHRGVKIDAEGDSLFFSFPSARSALAASIAGQTALDAESWPGRAKVLVRMGLHTGEATPQNGRYASLAVNQAARIMAAAHGGQILVSHATAAASSEALPPSTSLLDVGQFSLKDFVVPIQLFQICHPALRPEFPPPRVADAGGSVVVTSPGPRAASAPEHPKAIDSYRTLDTPTGAFRVPGDIHVHIDGGRNTAAIFETLIELEGARQSTEARFPMKFNGILRFSAGPQREDRAFAETYRYHTPGSEHREAFDTFSTVWLGDGSDLEPDSVEALATILENLPLWPGAVVELERVIGVLQPGGIWTEADPPRIADPDAFDVAPLKHFERLTTSPIEIHHSVDFPKTSGPEEDRPVMAVDELPTWPNLGGWFLFDKGDIWSYRSSEFVDRSGEYRYAACVGQRRLLDFVSEFDRSYELHTLVEQVLGIWRGGRQARDERSSVPALGEWEMSCPAGGDVWVIAANFFGDRSPDVRRAMVRNLSQDVTYTYFLRTHADVLRLSLLAHDLERDLIARGHSADRARRSVANRVRCVLLATELGVEDQLRRLLSSDYFICPSHPEMGGYRLDSSGFSGERLDQDEYEYLVGALGPLINTKIRGLFSTSEESWASTSSHRTVVCTDLEQSAIDQDQDFWRSMLAAYDSIVATEVSTHGAGCLVVRPVRNGYLLLFDDSRAAAEWAKRLQFAVQWRNDGIARRLGREMPIPTHNIALGYGSVTRILRAHGYDYVGGPIDDCIQVAARLKGGQIAMSRVFADQYEGRVGKREFAAGTSSSSNPVIGEIRLLEWP